MHEFLPAKQILHRRHIERIAACEVCGGGEGDNQACLTGMHDG